MMKSVRKVVYGSIVATLTLLLAFSSLGTAHAAIFSGGTGSSSGGGGNYRPYWRYAASIDHYLSASMGNWAGSSYISSGNGWGREKLRRHLVDSQPACDGSAGKVLGVFVQEIGARDRSWRQAVVAVNGGYSATQTGRVGGKIPDMFRHATKVDTYDKLLNTYKKQGGKSESIMSQLRAQGKNKVPANTIICVTDGNKPGSPEKPTPTQETKIEKQTRENSLYKPQYSATNERETLAECLYSYAVEATPQLNRLVYRPKNGDPTQMETVSEDPIGEPNLHSQKAGRNLAFTTLYNQLISGKIAKDAATWEKLKKACNESKNFTPPSIDLDAKNKEGLAEGGILNFSVRKSTRNLSFTEATTTLQSCERTGISEERTRKLVRTRSGAGKPWGPWKPVPNWSAWKETSRKTTKLDGNSCVSNINTDRKKNITKQPPLVVKQPPVVNIVEEKPSTPELTNFWQIISAHCNEEDFKKLLSEAAGSSNAASLQKDSSGYITNVAYSKTYSKRPDLLDFGDDGQPKNTAKYKSSQLGFYDKECGYECTAKRDENSSNAEIKNNMNDGSKEGMKTDPGHFGAQANNSNTNNFEFFRNNVDQDFRVDLWYPISKNGVQYNGELAKTTTITKWDQGTPTMTKKDKGGTAVMRAVRGNHVTEPLFMNDKTKGVRVQKNWADGLSSGASHEIIAGQFNNFKIRANWASEDKKPHVLNFKWEYKPKVTTVVPTRLGFDAKGNPVRANNAPAVAPIEGKCIANFGATTGKQDKAGFQGNTGTGSTNNMDERLSKTPNLPEDDKSNVFIKFVRSTTE